MTTALEQWRIKNGLSGAELGRRLGISRPHVGRLLAGQCYESIGEVMQRIYATTNGEVTANDFFDLPMSPSRARELTD